MMDKLYEAIQTIKEECTRHERGCIGCQLETKDGYCLLDESNGNPGDWDLEVLKAVEKVE